MGCRASSRVRIPPFPPRIKPLSVRTQGFLVFGAFHSPICLCGLFSNRWVEIPLLTSRQPDSSRNGPATPSYGWPAPWLIGFWKGSMPRLATDMEAVQAPVPKKWSACARRCPVAFAEGRWRPQGLGAAICLQRQMQQEISPGSDRIAQRGTTTVRLHSRWRRRVSDCGQPAHEATAVAAWPAPNSLRASLAMRELAASTRARVDGAAAAVSVRRLHPAADAIRAAVRQSP